LNKLTLHPNILKTAETLLNYPTAPPTGIRLTQSDAWAKFGCEKPRDKYDNKEQRVHVDAWNHMLVVPPEWEKPVSIAMIVYLSDVEETGGSTAVVPRQGPSDEAYQYEEGTFMKTPGCGILPWINDREQAEDWVLQNHPDISEFRKKLYAREGRVYFKPGTVLVYRHDIWHRGTSLKAVDSLRVVLNLSFRRADCDWFSHWNPGWARWMYSREQILEKIIGSASVEQRTALGFPAPGHPYWTETSLRLVTQRYSHLGFDPKPYQKK